MKLSRLRQQKKGMNAFIELEPRTNLFVSEFQNWIADGFKSPPPLAVKWDVLTRWSRSKHWIETGTLWGETTEFLSKQNFSVITIEASLELYEKAKLKFKENSLVSVVNGLSENELNDAISLSIKNKAESISFWLDGHYSGGGTHQGPVDTPIVAELQIIENRLRELESVYVFIDDIRLFNAGNLKHKDYPNLDMLVNWANRNNLLWAIEQDIFICTGDTDSFVRYANG